MLTVGPKTLLLISLMTLALLLPHPASAGGPCTTHAELLWEACSADKRDDFLVHLADCMYLVGNEERPACREEARAARAEKEEECDEVFEARLELCELVGEQRFDLEPDPADFVDPDDVGDTVPANPYLSLVPGHTSVIGGDGELGVVTVTDEVVDIGGLPCRVVIDIAFEVEEDEEDGEIEYAPVESTRDWYAQDVSGDTWYCGENTFEIEDGQVDNSDGSFAHGTDLQRAGILVRAMPVPGEGNRQEIATDEAEDYVEYVSLAATPSAEEGGDAAIACAGGCLQTLESNPHDPGEYEFKYYIPGVGFVLATKFDDDGPTGEREEVFCIGDSLDVLDDPACGIENPDDLREELCVWSLGELCEDEDDDEE